MQKGKAEATGHQYCLIWTNRIVCFHYQMASTGEFDAHGFKALFGWVFDRRAVHFVEGTTHNSATHFGRFKDQRSCAQMKATFNIGHVRRGIRVLVNFGGTTFPSRQLTLLRFSVGRLGPLYFVVGLVVAAAAVGLLLISTTTMIVVVVGAATATTTIRLVLTFRRKGKGLHGPILQWLFAVFEQQLRKPPTCPTMMIRLQRPIKVARLARIQDFYRFNSRHWLVGVAAAKPGRDHCGGAGACLLACLLLLSTPQDSITSSAELLGRLGANEGGQKRCTSTVESGETEPGRQTER